MSKPANQSIKEAATVHNALNALSNCYAQVIQGMQTTILEQSNQITQLQVKLDAAVATRDALQTALDLETSSDKSNG